MQKSAAESGIFRGGIFFFKNQKWILIENFLLYTMRYVNLNNCEFTKSGFFENKILNRVEQKNSLSEFTFGF